MCTFSYKVLNPRRQLPNRLSVFSIFNCRYAVFVDIVNTDVGVGIGISKYRISVRYFGIPTQDYFQGQKVKSIRGAEILWRSPAYAFHYDKFTPLSIFTISDTYLRQLHFKTMPCCCILRIYLPFDRHKLHFFN